MFYSEGIQALKKHTLYFQELLSHLRMEIILTSSETYALWSKCHVMNTEHTQEWEGMESIWEWGQF